MRAVMPFRRDLGPLALASAEMDELMNRLLGEPLVENPSLWTPRIDIVETEKELIVKADLPGVEPKDVEATVRDGVLILRGERKEEKEEKGKSFHRIERFRGEFYRELPLPRIADAEKVTAAFAKGVLTVTIPKKPELLPRKIEVKPAD
jgi:HSP20 family protein